MSNLNAKESAALHLRAKIICPHCWRQFAPEQTVWVSEHKELVDDIRLGPEHQQRFLPTRFTVEGNAIDARGFSCSALACPLCHLAFPRQLIDTRPLFVSILGTPSCGKSFFLTTMTWVLRGMMSSKFGVQFGDADPEMNQTLVDYEATMFQSSDPDKQLPLADLIRKTELEGDLYQVIRHGQQTIRYVRPYLFGLRPMEIHPHFQARSELARIVCLYDNAGEHFRPGMDTTAAPVTRHLSKASFMLFLFDPTQDQRFRERCRSGSKESDVLLRSPTSRQDAVLFEAAARLRKHANMNDHAKTDRLLIVVLTKSDIWQHLLTDYSPEEPQRISKRGPQLAGLHIEKINQVSHTCRTLLQQTTPEVVAAAESLSSDVIYIPVSALGCSPEIDQARRIPVIRPRDIKPIWVTVPFLYGLQRVVPRLIPVIRRVTRESQV